MTALRLVMIAFDAADIDLVEQAIAAPAGWPRCGGCASVAPWCGGVRTAC